MTFENMSSDDRTTEPASTHNGTEIEPQSANQSFKNQICSSKNAQSITEQKPANHISATTPENTTTTPQTIQHQLTPTKPDQNLNTFTLASNGSSPSTCSSEISRTTLDDEIRSRLDKLNALSDLINSLECQFDEANSLFRETLKCSTEKLSCLARTIGSKSIRQARIYNAVKISVEQSLSDCQRACIRFEKANQDHQFAKNAIREAEERLNQFTNANCTKKNFVIPPSTSDSINSIDFSSKLTLSDEQQRASPVPKHCDNVPISQSSLKLLEDDHELHEQQRKQSHADEQTTKEIPSTIPLNNAAKYSEDLHQGFTRLIEAERERILSQREHMDRANKLMLDQEKLTKLERNHSLAIRRTQYYFDESRRFNAKLNSVKSDINQITEDILAAKQAYARTLRELEQFSEELHLNKKFFSG